MSDTRRARQHSAIPCVPCFLSFQGRGDVAYFRVLSDTQLFRQIDRYRHQQ